MFGLIKKKASPLAFLKTLKTDFHSHLIPGIDDGVTSMEESLEIAKKFSDLGFEHIITTPHIYPGVYNNDPQIIKNGFEQVVNFYQKNDLNIKFSVAAEYYVDEVFLNNLKEDQELLTFGKNYLLLETAFHEPPMIFDEVIFLLKSRQITPIFAHPERYAYLQARPDMAGEFLKKGLVFQLNYLSLLGYYSERVRDVAIKFLKAGSYSFIGSDCHKPLQAELLSSPLPKKTLDLLSEASFLNPSLK